MHSLKESTPKHKGTKALFKNPLLEKLSRTHILVPISILSLFSIGLVLYGLLYSALSIQLLIELFFIGLVFFTLIEYLIHRFVFHMNAETKTKQKIKYTVHGIHHEYPKDKDRLAMPPLMSGMISVLLFFICWVSMGEYTFGFLSGLLLGYTSYLFVHYAVHAFSPPSNFLKILWVNHAIHHYKDEEKAFGVSSPLWDMVFGTLPSKKN